MSTEPSKWTVIPGNHEWSMWFLNAAAARLRQLEKSGVLALDVDILTPIGRSSTPGSREDFTCDRCRKYQPSQVLTLFQMWFRKTEYLNQPGGVVRLFGGLCRACADRELISDYLTKANA